MKMKPHTLPRNSTLTHITYWFQERSPTEKLQCYVLKERISTNSLSYQEYPKQAKWVLTHEKLKKYGLFLSLERMLEEIFNKEKKTLRIWKSKDRTQTSLIKDR